MTDTRVAVGTDRLPWLADEPIAKPKKASNDLWVIVAGAILLVAAGSYWLGMRVGNQPNQPVTSSRVSHPSVSAPLPPARAESPTTEVPIASTPEVEPSPLPEVAASPAPVVRFEAPPRISRGKAAAKPVAPPPPKEVAADHSPAARKVPAAETPLTLWPATQSAGAAGRIVRIGAFGSRQQAKLGWRYMVRAYPAVAHLPATVVETRNSRHRAFYRFQIGTTSQAHSEVLCQRMEKIHLSCAVVGLPWKPKGVER